jgi:hypothetical protein
MIKNLKRVISFLIDSKYKEICDNKVLIEQGFEQNS